MDSHFWIKAWNEGRINFHLDSFHPILTEYFPKLGAKKGQSILVPLCGKSKDLLYLKNLNLHVHGIELSEQAVEAFFGANNLSPVEKTIDLDFTHYTNENLVISCGDFFKLISLEAYDFIYDRASLVALPHPMRVEYARVLTHALKVGGKYLLIVYDYDQSKMDGPPFSVDSREIHELYQNNFKIQQLHHQKPSVEGIRFSQLEDVKQVTYLLEKFR